MHAARSKISYHLRLRRPLILLLLLGCPGGGQPGRPVLLLHGLRVLHLLLQPLLLRLTCRLLAVMKCALCDRHTCMAPLPIRRHVF